MMNPSNKRVDFGADIDRILDLLPRNAIDIILSKLPIEDLVRTTILSRKWRYMWNSVSRIEFDQSFTCKYSNPYGPRITDIINEVLLLHGGPIHKFTLHIPPSQMHGSFIVPSMRIGCLSKWILFLSTRGVRDIDLWNISDVDYEMPSHIFSCQDLTYARFRQFKLSIPPDFHGFKSLLDLQLYNVRVETSALDSLLCGCPCLACLCLFKCSGFECINVSAPSLKVLHVDHGSDIIPICWKNSKDVTSLTLLADKCEENFEMYKVSELLQGLLKLENLWLAASFIKILYKIISKESISPNLKISINSIKYLYLESVNFNEREEFLSIICLLVNFSNLVKLTIKSNSTDLKQQGNYLNEIKCNSCCLSQLKTVDIKVKTAYKNPLTLIRFVLAKASSLQTLTFNTGFDDSMLRTMTPYLCLSIAQDLLQMERASQKAKVKFLCDGLTFDFSLNPSKHPAFRRY